MNFKYVYTSQAVADLEIDNIGDTCIVANDDAGTEWYLYIHTVLGWTTIFEYGPSFPDLDEWPFAVTCRYQRLEYNEKRISKIINAFLNEPTRNILQARETDVNDIKQFMRDLREVVE